MSPDQALCRIDSFNFSGEDVEDEVGRYIDLHTPCVVGTIGQRETSHGEPVFGVEPEALGGELGRPCRLFINPLPLLPIPDRLRVDSVDFASNLPIHAWAPVVRPPANCEDEIVFFLSAPHALTAARQQAVCDFLCSDVPLLESEGVVEKVVALLPSRPETFLHIANVLGCYRPALFRSVLLGLLDHDLLNEPTLEAMYVICSIASLESDYLDCFTNSCFRQLTRDAGGKQRTGLFISFLLQMMRSDLYRFKARADLWRARYPEIVAQFPLALTEG